MKILRFTSLAVLALATAAPHVYAQSGAASADASAKELAEMAYGKDKNGCGFKLSLYYVAMDRYKDGVPLNELSKFKMFEPIFKEVYDTLRTDGAQKVSLNAMKDYQNCVANAKPHSNPSREYDMAMQHNACATIGDLVSDTLDSIKRRQSAETVMRKYQNMRIDLSETPFDDTPDAELLFIAQLYDADKKGGFDAAVNRGNQIMVTCAR